MKINVVPFFICETKNGIDISEDYSLVGKYLFLFTKCCNICNIQECHSLNHKYMVLNNIMSMKILAVVEEEFLALHDRFVGIDTNPVVTVHHHDLD